VLFSHFSGGNRTKKGWKRISEKVLGLASESCKKKGQRKRVEKKKGLKKRLTKKKGKEGGR